MLNSGSADSTTAVSIGSILNQSTNHGRHFAPASWILFAQEHTLPG